MKRILILGDLHAGSKCAPWPTSWLPGDQPHRDSRYLTECLAHAAENLEPVDLLILNGDLIDGSQKKSGGLGLFNPRLRDQVAGAIELLTPFAKKAKDIIRVEGTAYHDDDHDPLFALDERFGVRLVTQVLNFGIPGGVLNVAHHPSFKFEWKGGGMSKTAFYNLVNSARKKAPFARWIIESHLHFYGEYRDPDVHVAACPCWQMPTPWAIKVNRQRFTADIGCLLMEADPNAHGGWSINPLLYDTPVQEVTVW